MTQEDRDYVRDQLKFIADLLHDMVEVEALREGLTVEEWTRKADQEIARHRVRLTGRKLEIAIDLHLNWFTTSAVACQECWAFV